MDLIVARVVHVLAVVLWIGGVAFVTMSLLPAMRQRAAAEALVQFELIERRFAWQSRATTLLAGASGLYMVHRLEAWDRFRAASFWWMHAMVAIWVVFTLVLFVLEPFLLRRWLAEAARARPEATLRWLTNLHRLMLAFSLITVAGAIAGAHGW